LSRSRPRKQEMWPSYYMYSYFPLLSCDPASYNLKICVLILLVPVCGQLCIDVTGSLLFLVNLIGWLMKITPLPFCLVLHQWRYQPSAAVLHIRIALKSDGTDPEPFALQHRSGTFCISIAKSCHRLCQRVERSGT
jgi:hypothetical protein